MSSDLSLELILLGLEREYLTNRDDYRLTKLRSGKVLHTASRVLLVVSIY